MGINRPMLNLANSIAGKSVRVLPAPPAVPRVFLSLLAFFCLHLFVLLLDPSILHTLKTLTYDLAPSISLFASAESHHAVRRFISVVDRAVSVFLPSLL